MTDNDISILRIPHSHLVAQYLGCKYCCRMKRYLFNYEAIPNVLPDCTCTDKQGLSDIVAIDVDFFLSWLGHRELTYIKVTGYIEQGNGVSSFFESEIRAGFPDDLPNYHRRPYNKKPKEEFNADDYRKELVRLSEEIRGINEILGR